MPVIFSPVDRRTLYYAGNVVFKTLNGGDSWTVISPDLTREHYEAPANLGAFTPLDPERGAHRGVIYTIAPSFRRQNLLWVGTDDGLIWVTHNGGLHWTNVTPPMLTPWSKVSLMEASHTDTNTAYAAINTFRLDDLRPHILRTHDGGATWTEIRNGIPDGEIVNVVREDPVQPGLLFAGTERAVYVSFDDGDHWQSLRNNMPASSMRDLSIHENDLVVGTHGRSLWILDDYAMLRDLAAEAKTGGASPAPASASRLFRLSDAYRVHWNRNTDTPLPPEEPAGRNPPDGAILDYALAQGGVPVTLEILDRAGRVVRRFASDDPPQPVDSTANIPLWWVRPEQRLSTDAGVHRFVWDLRMPSPPTENHDYPIAAVPHDTPREPRGPFVLPGTYTARLAAGGVTSSQPFVVRMDPRVRTSALGLQQLFAATMRIADALRRDSTALAEARGSQARATGAQRDSLTSVVRDLTRLDGQLSALLGGLNESDSPPTAQAMRAINEADRALRVAQARVDALR
jgi:hypothetical protein